MDQITSIWTEYLKNRNVFMIIMLFFSRSIIYKQVKIPLEERKKKLLFILLIK